MHPLVAAVLGFLPGLLWLWILWRKDDHEPEPRRLVLGVFGLGCCSALVVLELRPLFEVLVPAGPAQLSLLVDAFVATAATEETLKLLAFAGVLSWHREADEPIDGIVYGAAAGLGFASVENAIYLGLTGDFLLVVGRAFTATLVHAACSGALGFCLLLARERRGLRRWRWVAIGVGTAVVLHGTYDYFLLGEPGLSWLALLGALPLAMLLMSVKIRWARARSPEYHPYV